MNFNTNTRERRLRYPSTAAPNTQLHGVRIPSMVARANPAEEEGAILSELYHGTRTTIAQRMAEVEERNRQRRYQTERFHTAQHPSTDAAALQRAASQRAAPAIAVINAAARPWDDDRDVAADQQELPQPSVAPVEDDEDRLSVAHLRPYHAEDVAYEQYSGDHMNGDTSERERLFHASGSVEDAPLEHEYEDADAGEEGDVFYEVNAREAYAGAEGGELNEDEAFDDEDGMGEDAPMEAEAGDDGSYEDDDGSYAVAGFVSGDDEGSGDRDAMDFDAYSESRAVDNAQAALPNAYAPIATSADRLQRLYDIIHAPIPEHSPFPRAGTPFGDDEELDFLEYEQADIDMPAARSQYLEDDDHLIDHFGGPVDGRELMWDNAEEMQDEVVEQEPSAEDTQLAPAQDAVEDDAADWARTDAHMDGRSLEGEFDVVRFTAQRVDAAEDVDFYSSPSPPPPPAIEQRALRFSSFDMLVWEAGYPEAAEEYSPDDAQLDLGGDGVAPLVELEVAGDHAAIDMDYHDGDINSGSQLWYPTSLTVEVLPDVSPSFSAQGGTVLLPSALPLDQPVELFVASSSSVDHGEGSGELDAEEHSEAGIDLPWTEDGEEEQDGPLIPIEDEMADEQAPDVTADGEITAMHPGAVTDVEVYLPGSDIAVANMAELAANAGALYAHASQGIEAGELTARSADDSGVSDFADGPQALDDGSEEDMDVEEDLLLVTTTPGDMEETSTLLCLPLGSLSDEAHASAEDQDEVVLDQHLPTAASMIEDADNILRDEWDLPSPSEVRPQSPDDNLHETYGGSLLTSSSSHDDVEVDDLMESGFLDERLVDAQDDAEVEDYLLHGTPEYIEPETSREASLGAGSRSVEPETSREPPVEPLSAPVEVETSKEAPPEPFSESVEPQTSRENSLESYSDPSDAPQPVVEETLVGSETDLAQDGTEPEYQDLGVQEPVVEDILVVPEAHLPQDDAEPEHQDLGIHTEEEQQESATRSDADVPSTQAGGPAAEEERLHDADSEGSDMEIEAEEASEHGTVPRAPSFSFRERSRTPSESGDEDEDPLARIARNRRLNAANAQPPASSTQTQFPPFPKGESGGAVPPQRTSSRWQQPLTNESSSSTANQQYVPAVSGADRTGTTYDAMPPDNVAVWQQPSTSESSSHVNEPSVRGVSGAERTGTTHAAWAPPAGLAPYIPTTYENAQRSAVEGRRVAEELAREAEKPYEGESGPHGRPMDQYYGNAHVSNRRSMDQYYGNGHVPSGRTREPHSELAPHLYEHSRESYYNDPTYPYHHPRDPYYQPRPSRYEHGREGHHEHAPGRVERSGEQSHENTPDRYEYPTHWDYEDDRGVGPHRNFDVPDPVGGQYSTHPDDDYGESTEWTSDYVPRAQRHLYGAPRRAGDDEDPTQRNEDHVESTDRTGGYFSRGRDSLHDTPDHARDYEDWTDTHWHYEDDRGVGPHRDFDVPDPVGGQHSTHPDDEYEESTEWTSDYVPRAQRHLYGAPRRAGDDEDATQRNEDHVESTDRTGGYFSWGRDSLHDTPDHARDYEDWTDTENYEESTGWNEDYVPRERSPSPGYRHMPKSDGDEEDVEGKEEIDDEDELKVIVGEDDDKKASIVVGTNQPAAHVDEPQVELMHDDFDAVEVAGNEVRHTDVPFPGLAPLSLEPVVLEEDGPVGQISDFGLDSVVAGRSESDLEEVVNALPGDDGVRHEVALEETDALSDYLEEVQDDPVQFDAQSSAPWHETTDDLGALPDISFPDLVSDADVSTGDQLPSVASEASVVDSADSAEPSADYPLEAELAADRGSPTALSVFDEAILPAMASDYTSAAEDDSVVSTAERGIPEAFAVRNSSASTEVPFAEVDQEPVTSGAFEGANLSVEANQARVDDTSFGADDEERAAFDEDPSEQPPVRDARDGSSELRTETVEGSAVATSSLSPAASFLEVNGDGAEVFNNSVERLSAGLPSDNLRERDGRPSIGIDGAEEYPETALDIDPPAEYHVQQTTPSAEPTDQDPHLEQATISERFSSEEAPEYILINHVHDNGIDRIALHHHSPSAVVEETIELAASAGPSNELPAPQTDPPSFNRDERVLRSHCYWKVVEVKVPEHRPRIFLIPYCLVDTKRFSQGVIDRGAATAELLESSTANLTIVAMKVLHALREFQKSNLVEKCTRVLPLPANGEMAAGSDDGDDEDNEETGDPKGGKGKHARRTPVKKRKREEDETPVSYPAKRPRQHHARRLSDLKSEASPLPPRGRPRASVASARSGSPAVLAKLRRGVRGDTPLPKEEVAEGSNQQRQLRRSPRFKKNGDEEGVKGKAAPETATPAQKRKRAAEDDGDEDGAAQSSTSGHWLRSQGKKRKGDSNAGNVKEEDETQGRRKVPLKRRR